MKKTYVTFGLDHAHRVNGKTLDLNCVAVINHTEEEDGRAIAFELFGPKFSFEYPEERWDDSKISYFPRGYITVRE